VTQTQANILAGLMPNEVAEVLRVFGKADMDGIAGATIDYLKEFKLILHTKNLLNNEFIWTLTADGKKVVKALTR